MIPRLWMEYVIKPRIQLVGKNVSVFTRLSIIKFSNYKGDFVDNDYSWNAARMNKNYSRRDKENHFSLDVNSTTVTGNN